MVGERKLIFVGGIHGVGKSTICTQVCADLRIEYISTSKLISDCKNSLDTANTNRDKRVADINENQKILIEALNKFISPLKSYLIDGHFTLFDLGGHVQPIPISTFKAIMPSALIVLTDDSALIRKRLMQRDGVEYDERALANMQAKELSHAKRVGAELKAKVYVTSVNKIDNLKKIIVRSLEEVHLGSL